MSEPSERRYPSLSASRIATSETSGRSSPSRRRFTPTSTSNSPLRRSRRILTRSSVSTSAWRDSTRTPTPREYSGRGSAVRLGGGGGVVRGGFRRHALGEGRDEDPLLTGDAVADLLEEVVHLPLDRADVHD